MHLTTHIIGSNKASIAAQCSQLLAQDIIATHLANDEFFNAGAWSAYEVDLCNYEAIAASSIVVVHDTNPLTTDLAQQICYAIAQNKPIVLTHELVFTPDADRRLTDIILHHAQQFHTPLSNDHLGNFLHTLPRKQQYGITAHEQLRIVITGRDHFRNLLQKSIKPLRSLTMSAL